ncbi:MAG: VOC family protein [Planctomycetia bacterium]|nr:VOC family protein [Planctomycetia bacterium]
MAVSFKPPQSHTITPYLIVRDCRKAMEFYAKAFSAESVVAMPGPDGNSIMHAEIKIGDSMLMLTDENPAWGCRSPLALGGTAVSLHAYVENVDKSYERAVAAGCTGLMPPADMFWGDRFAKLRDPFGHEWSLATHQEDVTPAEMQKRQQEFFASMQSGGACKS